MGSKGRFTLLGLLIVLSVLYDSGHSLRCYNCPNAVGACTVTTNCTANEDACLYAKIDTRTVYRCYRFQNCKYEDVAKEYGGSHLKYECCQKDLCNRSGGTSITGTMALLVAPLLTAFWRLLI